MQLPLLSNFKIRRSRNRHSTLQSTCFGPLKPPRSSVFGRYKPDSRHSFTVLTAIRSISSLELSQQKYLKEFRNLAEPPNCLEPCGNRISQPCGNTPRNQVMANPTPYPHSPPFNKLNTTSHFFRLSIFHS